MVTVHYIGDTAAAGVGEAALAIRKQRVKDFLDSMEWHHPHLGWVCPQAIQSRPLQDHPKICVVSYLREKQTIQVWVLWVGDLELTWEPG